MPILVRSLRHLAFALVLAIRMMCLATLELQFMGLASPTSMNNPPLAVFPVALQIAVCSFSFVGN